MKKRTVAFFLAASLIASVLGGCAKGNEAGSPARPRSRIRRLLNRHKPLLLEKAVHPAPASPARMHPKTLPIPLNSPTCPTSQATP